MFGSHLSIAGGMHNALLEAESLKLDCVQVFTKNQQQWKAPPLQADAVAQWKSELSRLGWAGQPRVTSHASYLINMGSPDDALREQSIALMREEIERCETLDIPLLVFHPGAHTTAPREQGIARIADACARLLRETPGYRTVLCLENVAGAGSHIGRTFEELADLRARIAGRGAAAERVGFCIDTCHAHAAGYDLSTPELARAALDQLDDALGITSVRCMHLNDSKGAAGSRLDRHEHIGKGTIGKRKGGGFPAFLQHPHLRGVPKVLETPKGENARGVAHDTLNVRRLRAMMA
ncbi:MAG: deoxyribonuclease IV [Phycisphaerales bacterium]